MAYTTIDDPSAHFQTDLHTGDGSGSTETFDGNSDLQPDFLWYKSRSVAGDHGWVDTSRSKPSSNNSFFILRSNSTSAEISVNSGSDFTAMNSDGYTYGSVHYLDLATNNSQNTVWGWKANGGTTSTNTAGTNIDTTVQANTTAGFSIMTYTGTGTDNDSIGHGLGAVPHWIIVKNRDETNGWQIYHHKNTSAPETDYLNLNDNGATADDHDRWSDQAPSSTVITLGGNDGVSKSSVKYVCYAFTEIQGYSKFGGYKGNGNTDGAFVYTGFKPAWVMIKRTNDTQDWPIFDNKLRPSNNVDNYFLYADLTNAQDTSDQFDIVSNGFKLRMTSNLANGSGDDYVYMAFAEHPFVSSKGVPLTAR